MPVRKLCYILASIVLCACTLKKELQIIPIEDDYAKKNGGIPVEGYYYIENFKDTKDSIAKMFLYLENKVFLSPLLQKRLHLLDDKSDVVFDDGKATVNQNREFHFLIDLGSKRHFDNIILTTEEYIRTYNFLKENQQSYNIVQKENTSIIKMAYKDITIETLQHFLNIVAYERRQTKDQLGQYSYQLQHKESDAIDCEIIYYNDPEKGLNNVFKIRFP